MYGGLGKEGKPQERVGIGVRGDGRVSKSAEMRCWKGGEMEWGWRGFQFWISVTIKEG